MSGDNEELKQALQAAIDSWPSKPWLVLPGPTDISPGLVTHLLAALQTGGWELVKVPEGVDPTQVVWSWRHKTTAKCSWCNELSRGTAEHNDGQPWPSCGQHGRNFAAAAERELS